MMVCWVFCLNSVQRLVPLNCQLLDGNLSVVVAMDVVDYTFHRLILPFFLKVAGSSFALILPYLYQHLQKRQQTLALILTGHPPKDALEFLVFFARYQQRMVQAVQPVD